MTRHAFRHKHNGEVHITARPDHYADDNWERVPVPKPVRATAEDRRKAKVAVMSSVERYDEIMAAIAALQARLDKAGL